MSELEILDPTGGRGDRHWELAAPVSEPARVGLLDISKPRGDVFLDEVERLLRAQGHEVERFRKVTMARPATDEQVRRMISQCQAAVVALAD